MSEFADQIAPLFRDKDVAAMSFLLDLHSHEDVKEHAEDVLRTVAEGSMPCDQPWDEQRVALFRDWVGRGCPQ